jgi:hypothetical protein
MDKKNEHFIDYEVLMRITKESMERGTSPQTLVNTLVKIGLPDDEADDIVKKAQQEMKKKTSGK